MNPTLFAGLLLGALVAAWTFVMGFTGWYKHPQLLALFWLVIPLQIGLVVWSLWKTAPRQGYGRQVASGVALSVIASVIIFGGSLLFTTVVFPHYFQELETLGRQIMAQQGVAPARIDELIREQASWQKPMPNAFAGVFGTWVTGFMTSLIAAVWLRRKKG